MSFQHGKEPLFIKETANNHKHDVDFLSKIRDIPIAEIVGKHTELKPDGTGLKASCPFHQEKTPSFKINLRTNRYNCFGCGERGDGIDFIMKLHGKDFKDAVEEIAMDHSIGVIWNGAAQKDPAVALKEERLKKLSAVAGQFFFQHIWDEDGKKAREYALNRWDEKTIKEWGLGFAPDSWTGLVDYARGKGFSLEDLKEAGLAAEKNSRVYDVFRNRLMFPILNKHGQVVAFIGRNLTDEKPKYINTKETSIYHKGSVLFGFDRAVKAINEEKELILVEGAPDVIRLHEQQIYNSVAQLGTFLTDDQVNLIKGVTTSVTIIPDSDDAGIGAMHKNTEKLIGAGLFVSTVLLKGEGKQDPDSFFKQNKPQEFFEKNNKNYLILQAESLSGKSLQEKQKGIKKLASLIINYPGSDQELFLEEIGKITKSKTAIRKALDEVSIKEKKTLEKYDKDFIPKEVELDHFKKYGFYIKENQTFFGTRQGIQRGANFVLLPIHHIESTTEAKRIFEIINEFGFKRLVEFNQRDLISLQSFKLKIESLGNFLWELGEAELGKLKRYLYEKTDTCTEVKQLGWQKEGFWAWANGIFEPETNTFQPVNEFGIAEYNKKKYYIPAFSRIFAIEQGLFVSEREFIHRPGSIALLELINKLDSVFGQNSQVLFAYMVATLFRDLIVARFGFFPILNVFGPKGTGKTELAWIFLQFFGKLPRGINLSASKASIADHVAHRANSLSHLEEYKNNLDFEKVEFLKGIYDNTGRTRMNMEKDRKKETTAVDSGIVLTGQEMPTVDVALFSRLIFLTFNKTEFSEAEKKDFSELKDLSKEGFTYLTHQILSHRGYFQENFLENYQAAEKEVSSLLGNDVIEARIQNNWTILVAAFKTLKDKLQTGISYDRFLREAVQLIRRQNSETKQGDDVANFWKIFKYLVANQTLTEDVDFSVKVMDKITTTQKVIIFEPPQRLLILNHTRTFQEYLSHGNRTRTNVLPVKSLEYYLESSKEFIGRSKASRFNVIEKNTKEESFSSPKTYTTTAFIFKYDSLCLNHDMNLNENYDSKTENYEAQEPQEAESSLKNDLLPF